MLTEDELQCEEHFKTSLARDNQGHFLVRLPIKRAINNLGDSRTLSRRMLTYIEKRFSTDSTVRIAYIEFMREYLNLDHTRPSVSYSCGQREFFLSYYGVVRQESSTTKLRVIFNGCQRTSLRISLNDCLHVGLKLQTDIATILMRWRRHPFVFAANIIKIYRQIQVHKDD